MSEVTVVQSQIYNEDPIIKVYDKEGSQIKSSEVILDTNTGVVISVVDSCGKEYTFDQIDVCTNFLNVPGVGFIKPGTIVRITGEGEYVLLHGEHTNISNQTLIGWYLEPINYVASPDPLGRVNGECRTLYKSMIDKIDLVTV